MMAHRDDPRPLIAHVVYCFDTGGLENGVVNLINRLPREKWRHAIIALTKITEFRRRIERDDVEFIALDKRPGHGALLYPKMTRLLRTLEPAIVHTRNLAALEMTVPAWWTKVPVRIHGEHGRDVEDLDGSRRRYQWVRRFYRPFVTHYVALSHDLERYLVERVRIPQPKVEEICNGVDTERFRPGVGREPIAGCPFRDPTHWLVGTVGRMQPVKDQANLACAFVRAVELDPALRDRLRLVLVGDGPLLADARTVLQAAGMSALAWLPGERSDVPAILRGLDTFVLPSLAEGISNTILEAMASGLPVIATAVGGNPELVVAGGTGDLVPASDPEAMARAIIAYARNPSAALAAGRAGRARVEANYSLVGMVTRYDALYTRLLAAKAHVGAASAATATHRSATVAAAAIPIAPEGAPTNASHCTNPVGAALAATATHRSATVAVAATPIAPEGAPTDASHCTNPVGAALAAMQPSPDTTAIAPKGAPTGASHCTNPVGAASAATATHRSATVAAAVIPIAPEGAPTDATHRTNPVGAALAATATHRSATVAAAVILIAPKGAPTDATHRTESVGAALAAMQPCPDNTAIAPDGAPATTRG